MDKEQAALIQVDTKNMLKSLLHATNRASNWEVSKQYFLGREKR